MKKFTLFFMSLFLAVGAMAQTPVVTVDNIGTAPYKLDDADAAKIFKLENLTVVLDVTTAASLSGRGAFFCVADPAQAVPGSFSGSNTSFMACGHVNASIAYLAAAKDGQHFSTGTIPANSTIRIAYVFDKTNNKFKSYIGDTNTGWTMDRDFGTYEIATPKMVKEDFANANIYIGGGMANDANHELGDATIHKVRVYNGTLTVDEIKNLDFVKEISDFENGKIYTFESQRGWLMAKSGTDFVYNSTKITDANAGKDNANCQWVLYSTDKGNYLYNVGVGKFISVNKNNANSIPLSASPTTGAVEFKASSLTAYPIILGVEGYAINHNVENSAFAYGALLWKDGWKQDTWLNDAGSCHKVTLIGDADETVLETIAGAVATYENMPVAGKYYTFKNDSYYITSSVTSGGRIALSTTKDATAIYYFDGSHLLAYTTGLYIGLNSNDWTFEAIGSNDISAIEFVAAANGDVREYNIKSGGRWLHRTDAFVNRCSNNTCGDAHNWTIEKVESLPVTITAAKYATFYAPVAVEVADGVTAYSATVDAANNRVELTEISDVIPANTGVVLYSETAATYNFTITENVEAIESDLRGSAAATYYTATGTYYALGLVDGKVGFYKDAFNNSRFQNNSHKAYLYVEGTQNAASYSFRFGEGTTGVENVEVENEVKAIFDLTGRRVEAITAPGIYIVNGKKVLVK